MDKEFEWQNGSYKDYIKNFIAASLDDYENVETRGDELGYLLTERENVDGSVFYNTYETTEFIKNFFDEIGEVYIELKDEIDIDIDPFINPEEFNVAILMKSVNDLLSETKFIGKNQDKTIKLTKENINMIKKELGIELEKETNFWNKEEKEEFER